jgi:putative membrane protein
MARSILKIERKSSPSTTDLILKNLEIQMQHSFWNDWYFGWGWLLWFGFLFLAFSSFGNWGYTYSAHRKYGLPPQKEALDYLNERYARGEITQDDYLRMKSEIAKTA